MTLRLLALAILTTTTMAHAEALTSVIVDRPGDNRVDISAPTVAVRDLATTSEVTLALTVASRAEDWHAAKLTLSVPHGARVTGLTIGKGNELLTAQPKPKELARRAFDESIRLAVEPALLEYKRRTRDYDRLELSVFPVSREETATATVTITMPRFRRIVVNVAGQRIEQRGGSVVEDRAEVVVGVDEQRSLYLGPAADTIPSVAAKAVRAYVHADRAAIRMCYEFFSNGDAQDIALRFTIGTNGRVTDSSLGGDLGAGGAECLTNVMAFWRFHPSDEPVAVNYPLHLPASVRGDTLPR